MKIKGTDLDDTLMGTTRADVIRALAGNDTIHGGGGRDRLYGGDGDDTIFVQASGSASYGEAGDDTFIVEANVSRRTAPASVDGGEGADTFDLSHAVVHADNSPFLWSVGRAGIMVDDFVLNGVETLIGGAGANAFALYDYGSRLTLVGGEQADGFELPSSGGEAIGNGGDDRFSMSGYQSRALGGAGDDFFTFGGRGNSIDLYMNGGKGI